MSVERTNYSRINLADPELELIDPTPNVHNMFIQFDQMFFWTKLASRAVVRWSKRMYSSAGLCYFSRLEGVCDIALSEPLLKLRPRKDLVETLLHEMIHAFLIVTSRDQDRDCHGPNFQAHMHRINNATGLKIDIYHDFDDEVVFYQTHRWRCDGPCHLLSPHFGIVRRTNNRPPGPRDHWWSRHQQDCGGTFIKFKEPEKKVKKAAAPSTVIDSENNVQKAVKHKAPIHADSPPVKVKKIDDNFKTTATSLLEDIYGENIEIAESNRENNKLIAVHSSSANHSKVPEVDCPICKLKVSESSINSHLDECLNKDIISEICTSTEEIKQPNAEEAKQTIKLPPVKLEPGTSAVSALTELKCPCCGLKVSTTIDDHLEECLSFFGNNDTMPEVGASTSFADHTIVIDDDDDDIFDESQLLNATGTKFPCPCCLQMVEHDEMNAHLDSCLT